MFDFGIEAITCFNSPIWFVEFRDYSTIIVLGTGKYNFILVPISYEQA